MHAANPRTITHAGLTHVELTTLSRIYFDGCTQLEVAGQDEVTQQTIAARVRTALEKLSAANVPPPQRPEARHRRRAHRPTCEPVDPALLNRLRPGRSGRFHLGPGRRIVDRPSRALDGRC